MATLIQRMKTMRNLSIKIRLSLFTGTVVLLLIIVALSGWIGVSRVGAQLTGLSEQNVPAITHLMRMRTWQLTSIAGNKTALSLDMSDYESMPDKSAALGELRAYFRDVLKEKTAADAEAQTYFERYAKLPKTPEEAKAWQTLREVWTIYLDSNVVTAGQLKRIAEADVWERIPPLLKEFQRSDGEIQGASARIQAQLDILIAFNQSYVKQATEDGAHAQHIARLLILSVAAIALLLCAVGSWRMTRSITLPLLAAVGVARRVADGDLTASVEVRSTDETGQLMQALKDMNGSIQNIVGQIRSGTETIATATSQIASGNLDLSYRTEQQASSLGETASSMEQMMATARQNGENAREANQLAAHASDVAIQGGQVVSQVVVTMGAISDASRKMADIIGVIDGIAFQTNILALNAAVEAARAGEHGRGFAVVAAEVRNLAQRAATAAKEIKGLIDDSVGKVQLGTGLVNRAGTTMNEVVASVQKVNDIMGQITIASHEQEGGIGEINGAIAAMDGMTQRNAALVEEAAAAAASLREQAASLAMVVSVFKLDETRALAVGPVSRQPRVSASTEDFEEQDGSARPAAMVLPGSGAGAAPASHSPHDVWEIY